MSAHLRDDLAFDGCGPRDDVLDVVDVCGKGGPRLRVGQAARTLSMLPIPAVESIDTSNAILYLVSDDGRHVTGTTHLVDAGDQL
ncbi:hypothetical protein [Geodermatophilus normandii]|jgi:hypothetical protein|uniref:hypothetical protein n=1 Tax=Geodermatophilus normandii TaxID=1137989 RepID=UPI001952BBB2|nr:hypothetical protein [Geodermatophilus normandii]